MTRSVLGLSPFDDDRNFDAPLGSTTPEQRDAARLSCVVNVPGADLPTVLQALGLIPFAVAAVMLLLGLMPYLEAPTPKPRRRR